MAAEGPKYTIIQKNDLFEIREYNPYLVAQTDVSGTFDEMGRKAFRILVKYISGDNEQKSSIEITTPVLQENAKKDGQKIPMTSPVIQKSCEGDSHNATFSFVMPQNFTLDTLPVPRDSRITLKQIQAKRIAVLQYSGGWGEEKYKKNEAILLRALHKAGIKTIGVPHFARYNSPFTLWFMRRNEIMIEVQR